jgi:hypothetical protein
VPLFPGALEDPERVKLLVRHTVGREGPIDAVVEHVPGPEKHDREFGLRPAERFTLPDLGIDTTAHGFHMYGYYIRG